MPAPEQKQRRQEIKKTSHRDHFKKVQSKKKVRKWQKSGSGAQSHDAGKGSKLNPKKRFTKKKGNDSSKPSHPKKRPLRDINQKEVKPKSSKEARLKLKKLLSMKKGPEYWKAYKEIRKKKLEKRLEDDKVLQVSVKAKQSWEELRREDCQPERKVEICKDLYRIVRGKVAKLVMAPDMSRVVESMMQFGDIEVRAALFEELKSKIVELCSSVYAHFFVLKLLKYGSKQQREFVVDSFRGHVPELMRHKVASSVVESAFNEWSNASQRGCLLQEFYDPHFKVFKDTSVTSFSKFLETHPEKRESSLEYFKENLMPLVDKGLMQHSLVHRLLFEYVNFCSEADMKELIESIREHLAQCLHTRDGTHVAMHCIWKGNAKDRKVIVKSWKTHVPKICMDENGYKAILAAFDCIDDTIVVTRIILGEILSSFKELAFHKYGRKVILYVLCPRDPRHLHPEYIKLLAQGDSNPHSKKHPELRQAELLAAASKSFLREVLGSPEDYLSDNGATLVFNTVLEKCLDVEGSQEAFQLLAEKIKEPLVPGEVKHIVERSATHLMLKKLIVTDKQRKVHFSDYLLDAVTSENLEQWITCNRGAFILIALLESGVKSIEEKARKKLIPLKPKLRQQTSKGAQILLKKLV